MVADLKDTLITFTSEISGAIVSAPTAAEVAESPLVATGDVGVVVCLVVELGLGEGDGVGLGLGDGVGEGEGGGLEGIAVTV